MLLYDPKVPEALKLTQEWFGKIISSPLLGSKIAKISPAGGDIIEESAAKICPSPTLKPYERLQIYNQQYWWRLLTAMQDSYPFAVRLFGYSDFNAAIGIPYLTAYPPCHWALDALGKNLPKWLSEHYCGNDKQLVYDAAVLDLAYLSLFFKPLLPILADDEFDQTIYLQPHAAFLHFPYDLISLREAMIQQEPDYWLDNPFPELIHTPQSLLLYRSLKGYTTYKCLSLAEFALLQLFQKGSTVDSACGWIEQQSPEFRKEAEESLQKWFQDWTIRGILTNATDQKRTD
jgi:hypothetical protein